MLHIINVRLKDFGLFYNFNGKYWVQDFDLKKDCRHVNERCRSELINIIWGGACALVILVVPINQAGGALNWHYFTYFSSMFHFS